MPFFLEQLGRVLVPEQPSAFGSQVVYSLRRTAGKRTFSNIWRVGTDGWPPVQLTRGDHRDSQPVGDPAGEFVIFVSDRSGSAQLWRLDRDGGEASRVTALPVGSISSPMLRRDRGALVLLFTPAVDPDAQPPMASALVGGHDPDAGPDLAPAGDAPKPFEKAEPRARVYVRLRNRLDGAGWESVARPQVWIVDLLTGDARRLAGGAWSWASARFGMDGDVYATRTAVPDGDADLTRNQLVRINSAGEISLVKAPEGLAGPCAQSPDGKLLAYVHGWADDVFGSRNPLLTLLPATGGSARHLGAPLDRPAGDLTLDDLWGGAFADMAPLWLDDARVVVVVTDHGSVRLWCQNISGRGDWLTEPGQCASLPARVNDKVVVHYSTAASFPEIGVVGPSGTVKAITAHNAALALEAEPRMPKRVQIRVSNAGHTVPGWYLPSRSGKVGPAILQVHGGPHANYGERLLFEMQWLSDQGFSVLWTNPRGSTSYGEAWCGAIDGDWGNLDREDLLSAAAWLRVQPEVDAQRVGMTGGSYGGYMALVLAGSAGEFAAFVAQRGLFDWSADYGGSDFGFSVPDLFEGKRPWEAPEAYWKQSPLRLVDSVSVPFLLVCQEADMRCEEGQSFAVFNALRGRGVPTAIVVFPEESHSMSRVGRVDRRQESLRQIADWFWTYL